MKFEALVENFGHRPYLEVREAVAIANGDPKTIKNQLSAWARAGKLTRLRRGKYLLNEPYLKQMPSIYYISNCLLRPSYVSLHTALQFHGMIPEAVSVIKAISTKHGTSWETELGAFEYRTIKNERFWGYEEYDTANESVLQNRFLMATPEKALLDLFYLQSGEWTEPRLRQMRFQNTERIDRDRLAEFAARFDSPKVSSACRRFLSLTSTEEP